MKKNDRTGERFISNEGYEVVIVEYKNTHDVVVEFEDEYRARIHTDYDSCRKGKVKNPYHPSVCGIGCLGLMKDGSKPITTYGNGKHIREYDLWHSMITRCYSDKFHEECPTYKDCTVCERWLVFSNFLEDLPLIDGYELWRDNPNSRVSLDKDIKVQGNKVYSLDTCKFVSKSENSKERNVRCGTLKPSKKVMAISLTENKVIIFKSMRQAEKLGFDASCISLCCNGKLKSHKGYKWKCID